MFKREHWASRLGFILATTGSAVGLGNIWKFPYMAGVNGGGAFVIIYLICIAAIGLPIFILEVFIGQKGQSNVIGSFEKIDRKGSLWQICGWIFLCTSSLVLSFYSVVGGWVLDFEFRSLLNEFSGMSPEQITGVLEGLFSSATRQIFWHAVFMSVCIFIICRGVQKGLEKWNKILMPALLGILGLLFIRSLFLEGFGQAFSFLFVPDFSKITINGVLEAIGHSFFTLSIGLGTLLTYGSYLSHKERLPRLAITVATLDTVIALVAGIIIFSIVFSFGLEPGAGPALIFSTLPSLFVQMGGGQFLSIAFFLLVTLAAVTSAVSIFEIPVVFISEKFCMKREKATFIAGGIIFLSGILCVLSFNHLSDFKILGLNIFDLFDKTTSSWLMPLSGILMALFVGWKLKKSTLDELLSQIKSPYAQMIFLWTIRIVAPISILLIMMNLIIH